MLKPTSTAHRTTDTITHSFFRLFQLKTKLPNRNESLLNFLKYFLFSLIFGRLVTNDSLGLFCLRLSMITAIKIILSAVDKDFSLKAEIVGNGRQKTRSDLFFNLHQEPLFLQIELFDYVFLLLIFLFINYKNSQFNVLTFQKKKFPKN